MKLFEIKTANASIFKILIEAMKEILTETIFRISKDGIIVTDIDNTQSVLVKLHLAKNKFEEFFVDKPIEIGIEMITLYKLLKSTGNNDSLTLSMDDSNRSQLNIRIDNGKKGSKSISQMKLSDLDAVLYDIEKVQFDTVITLPSPDFQQICRDMGNYSEKMIITKVEDELQFSCSSDTINKQIIYKIGTTEGDGLSYLKNDDPEEIIRGVFLLEHLMSFTKCTNLCNYVELNLRNDYALIIKYSVGDLGTIRLCLAQNNVEMK
jgi:proliferating cell nuclear antigen